jgi:nuclear polyadenylated RNA-binding protein NAB2
MRNNRQGGNRTRMINQINKNLDRSGDPMLHRVRGQQGTARINTHGRDFGKGLRGQHGQSGVGRMGYGRQMGPMGQMQPGGQMHGSPAGNIMQMTPQNQMQFMALLEEQARMMAQFMPGIMSPAINPAFQPGNNQPQRSLFERVERQPQRSGGNPANRAAQNGFASQAPTHGTGEDHDMDITSDQPTKDDEQGETNTDSTCRFNLRCTKKDCPYAHQSPAAPEGTSVDPTDHCPFGAACKNKKCTGRHPSPAIKTSHQADEICRFFPHCTNPHCSFKHPSMPLCRNGADCSVLGCKFTHLSTACRFNPCLNRNCPYKHAEGQRGSFHDNVWTANGIQEKDQPHVSERKFVDENGPEELIKPETSADAAVSEALTA